LFGRGTTQDRPEKAQLAPRPNPERGVDVFVMLRCGVWILFVLGLAWAAGLLSLSAYADEAVGADAAGANLIVRDVADLLVAGCDREIVQARLVGGPALSPADGGRSTTPPLFKARPLDPSVGIFDPACIAAVLDLAPDRGEVEWQNDMGGPWYRLTAVKSFVDASGKFCRVFAAAAGLGSDGWLRYGMACRAPGGWTMVR
jgi:hypothetical protein